MRTRLREVPEIKTHTNRARGRWPRPRVVVAVLVALVVAGGGAAYLSSGWFRSQVQLSVSQRPRPFTELYFSDPTALPRSAPAGVAFPIEVSVVDHHGGRLTHTLEFSVSTGSGSRVMERLRVTVPDGGARRERFSFDPRRPGAVYVLTFTLDGSQRIDWKVLAG